MRRVVFSLIHSTLNSHHATITSRWLLSSLDENNDEKHNRVDAPRSKSAVPLNNAKRYFKLDTMFVFGSRFILITEMRPNYILVLYT